MPFSIHISCFFILLALNAPAQIYDFTDPLRLPGGINSSAEETNPVFAPDGKTIYFVRTLDVKNVGGIYDQDIWMSRLELGLWGNAKPIVNLNNKLNNALVAAIQDSIGSKLYLLSTYTSEKDNRKGIAVSNLKDSVWGQPIKVTIPDLDIDGKYVSYFLSQNEDVLVFSFEGSDSEGEEDLYIATKSSAGWNNWSKPINLGKKINSPKFDAYLIKRGNEIIWASNRDGKDCDLYSANSILPPKLEIKLASKDVTLFQGYDGQIDLTISSGVPPYKISWSNGQIIEDIDGLFKGKYTVTVIDAVGQKRISVSEINEPPIEDKKIIRFPGVQYEFNRWEFINDSIVNSSDSLAYVAKLLNDYPEIVIELISHTDSRGDDESNQILSVNRARACFKYLVEELKIDSRRIIPVGKGEKEPALWRNPSTGQTILLTETFINDIKENAVLYEQLNQLNRRTEGRIIRKDFNAVTFPEAPKEYFQFITIPK